jgi:hypothetical protein
MKQLRHFIQGDNHSLAYEYDAYLELTPESYELTKLLRTCPNCGSPELTWRPGDRHCRTCGMKIVNPKYH